MYYWEFCHTGLESNSHQLQPKGKILLGYRLPNTTWEQAISHASTVHRIREVDRPGDLGSPGDPITFLCFQSALLISRCLIGFLWHSNCSWEPYKPACPDTHGLSFSSSLHPPHPYNFLLSQDCTVKNHWLIFVQIPILRFPSACYPSRGFGFVVQEELGWPSLSSMRIWELKGWIYLDDEWIHPRLYVA